MVSTTESTMESSTTTSTLTLGTEVDGYSAPRYTSVWPSAAVALNLADGHADDSGLLQSRYDVLEREWLHDYSDQFHLSWSLSVLAQPGCGLYA